MNQQYYQPAIPEEGGLAGAFAAVIPPFRRVRAQYAELFSQYSELVQQQVKLQHSLEVLNQEKHDLETELSAAQEALTKTEKARLTEANRAETAEATLMELKSRYHLISSAISAEVVQSPRYLQFSKLLADKFLPFANRVNVLANEAESIIRLKAVEDQVRLVESLSRFKNKTVVAVSGGFSSGKSSFISSLFSDQNTQLPIGVQPITAIPTYVFHSEQNQIVGYSAHGGEVHIPADIYAQLSHEFVQNFGFNLRDLLPFIALETPIEQYENLSFIDLPGYNPGDREGFTGHDESSASEFMTQAQCILWVIGLDANGTISRADIDFLRDHVPQGTRLYVILNKADLKPLSDVQNVMQEVADMLLMDGIVFEGISAYSSEWQEELAYDQISLHDILAEWNEPKDTYGVLVEEINWVFSGYEQAFLADIQSRKEKTALIKALELDLHELGTFDELVDTGSFDISSYRRSSGAKAKPDVRDKRLNKILHVKQHLSDLRLDYDVRQRENELDELVKIWRSFRNILTFGSHQQSEQKGNDGEHVISEPQGDVEQVISEQQSEGMKHSLSEKKSELVKLIAVLSERTYG